MLQLNIHIVVDNSFVARRTVYPPKTTIFKQVLSVTMLIFALRSLFIKINPKVFFPIYKRTLHKRRNLLLS